MFTLKDAVIAMEISTASLFETFEVVHAAEGAHAAPKERAGKVRCRACNEWVPAHAIDMSSHARQERLGMGRRQKSVAEYKLFDQPSERDSHADD